MKLCIVGCERSGTSAVALLISKGCSLSLLDDPPEAWYATAQLRLTGRGIGRELAEEIRRHDVVKVPSFAAVLPELGRCFPSPFRVIYCVRDPRDAIASIRERLAQGESFMGHTLWLGVDSKNPMEALAWKWRIYLETALGYRNHRQHIKPLYHIISVFKVRLDKSWLPTTRLTTTKPTTTRLRSTRL